MIAIRTESLTKYYGKNRGISKVDLSVQEGEFFGFIGPNGAGKSTTIRTLLGLISADSGTAEVLGCPVTHRPPSGKQRHGGEKLSAKKALPALLSRVGYMPSEAFFYGGMRVRDILRLSAGLRKRDCREEAESLCKRLELDPSRKAEELSLGNRKKVSIVCALQHRPDLYILDEPTSGLDPLIQREFFSLLKERNQEGTTVFFSSHVLAEVQRYCGRAAIIREGKIIACDRIDNLGHTGAKRISLQTPDNPAILKSLSGEGSDGSLQLPGIRDLQVSTEGVAFLYSGDMQSLLRTLSELPIADLTIAEPDLEEVFLHYYENRPSA